MTRPRRWAPLAQLLVVIAGVLGVCLFTVVIPVPHAADPTLAYNTCGSLRRGGDNHPLREQDSTYTGFGIVRDCRYTGSRDYLFRLRRSRYYFLLRTTNGAFTVHVDYHPDPLRGSTTVTEADPADAPGLSKAERDQVRADIAARSGLTGTWTLIYGDG